MPEHLFNLNLSEASLLSICWWVIRIGAFPSLLGFTLTKRPANQNLSTKSQGRAAACSLVAHGFHWRREESSFSCFTSLRTDLQNFASPHNCCNHLGQISDEGHWKKRLLWKLFKTMCCSTVDHLTQHGKTQQRRCESSMSTSRSQLLHSHIQLHFSSPSSLNPFLLPIVVSPTPFTRVTACQTPQGKSLPSSSAAH